MDPRTVVLVTNTYTSTDFEIVGGLCGSERCYDVLVGARSPDLADEAIDKIKKACPSSRSRLWPTVIAIEDDASIQGVLNYVDRSFGKLDVLVNSATLAFDHMVLDGEVTMRQVWDVSWSVNTVSAQIITSKFVPLLLKSSEPRLLFVTDSTSTLTETEDLSRAMDRVPAAGWPKTDIYRFSYIPAYRSSKCGMNMMMREWYRMLKNDGVKVWGIAPEDYNENLGPANPPTVGQFIRDVLEGRRHGSEGRVLNRNSVQAW